MRTTSDRSSSLNLRIGSSILPLLPLIFILSFISSCSFDYLDREITSIMKDFDFTGVSLAVVRDDRLVYSKAYGYSDREESVPAETGDIYRIASVSKLITAAAVFQLVEQGKITLNDKVFGNDSILGYSFGTPANHVDQITVRHLLEYGSGFEEGSGANFSERITDRVTSDLKYQPGIRYRYKNIDYTILGRIIEKVTGAQSYEKYIQENVLSICGIENMAIGLAQRKPNEVKYYTPSGPLNMNSLVNSDSSGGWIASAEDLAKFFIRINNNAFVKDILVSTFTDYRPVSPAVRVYNIPPFPKENWYYYGDMNGTRSIMCKVDKRTGFILLINSSLNGISNYRYYARSFAIASILRNIKEWPSFDLFHNTHMEASLLPY